MYPTELLSDSSIDPLSSILTQSATVFGIPDWICWIIIAVMLLISGLFSASENAFSNCNKYHFKVLADQGKITPKIIVRLTEKFEDTLVSVLVGNNIVQTLMSFISAVLFYNLLQGTNLANYEALISTVVMAFLVYIVSDTCPKILSKAIPNKMVYILAWPDFILSIVLYPIILIFRLILKGVHKIFKIKDENMLTREDFIEKADEAVSTENVTNSEEQLFEPNEMVMLKRAFYFDTIEASQVLTPLDKIVSINIKDLTSKKVNNIILNSPYSRFPIYHNRKDNIVGVLSVNSYFKEYAEDPHLDIRSVISQPLFVNEKMKVDEIFEAINKEKVHLAIVKNESSKVIGMVTMEDILDVLVEEQTPKSIEKKDEKEAKAV